MRRSDMNRRSFLGTAGTGATALTLLASHAPAVLAAKSPNDMIGVGLIGVGVRGSSLLTEIAGREMGGGVKGTKVVAVCDAYKGHRDVGVERSMNPDVKAYVDYKELLADPKVDAVVIATPDHWHKTMLIDAANAGKDVYIEKGWTRSIAEAKEMLAAVKKTNIVMQLGHQSRAQVAGIQGAQLIRDGLLGPVTLVKTGRFENNPLGKNIYRWYGWYDRYERPDPKEVEPNVDWQRWLGASPKIPFNFEHFWHWRCYWPYGTGVVGDLLSHEVDFVQSVLQLGIPDACISTGQNVLLTDGRDCPDTWNSIFRYEKKGCTVTFDCSLNSAIVQPPEFHGKEAMMKFDSIAQSVETFDVVADPKTSKYADDLQSGKIAQGKPFLKFDPKKTPPVPSHMEDFFNCVRSRQKTKCNEDQAFIEAATIVMAMKAYQEKREVRWDAEKQDVV